jgi:hypothetical protein
LFSSEYIFVLSLSLLHFLHTPSFERGISILRSWQMEQ